MFCDWSWSCLQFLLSKATPFLLSVLTHELQKWTQADVSYVSMCRRMGRRTAMTLSTASYTTPLTCTTVSTVSPTSPPLPVPLQTPVWACPTRLWLAPPPLHWSQSPRKGLLVVAKGLRECWLPLATSRRKAARTSASAGFVRPLLGKYTCNTTQLSSVNFFLA